MGWEDVDAYEDSEWKRGISGGEKRFHVKYEFVIMMVSLRGTGNTRREVISMYHYGRKPIIPARNGNEAHVVPVTSFKFAALIWENKRITCIGTHFISSLPLPMTYSH